MNEQDYVLALKEELVRVKSDKDRTAAVKAELARVTGNTKSTAAAAKNAETAVE